MWILTRGERVGSKSRRTCREIPRKHAHATGSRDAPIDDRILAATLTPACRIGSALSPWIVVFDPDLQE
jgi:hypothetical protein